MDATNHVPVMDIHLPAKKHVIGVAVLSHVPVTPTLQRMTMDTKNQATDSDPFDGIEWCNWWLYLVLLALLLSLFVFLPPC